MAILGRRRALEAKVAALEAAAASPAATGELGGGRFAVAGPRMVTPWDFYLNTGYVTRDDAMGVPTLAFIRNQMAGGIASMPLERFRTTSSGDETQIYNTWTENPDVAPTIPPSIFWAWVIDDLFFQGKCTLVVLARDYDGWPIWVRRVLPGQVTYDPQQLAYGYAVANMTTTYLGDPIKAQDVVVINGPHEGICNYMPVTIRQALDLEAASAQSAAEPMPNIELHQTGGEVLSDTDAGDLVDRWGAARKQGATAYTPPNLEAKPIGFSSQEMQQVEGRQYMATQLARGAGVNPVLVSAAMGAASSYVYTNQADYRQAFLDDVLDAYLQAIEGRFSANDVTPRGQHLRFDRDDYTQMPEAERIQIMLGAMKAGADPRLINQLSEVLDLDFALPEDPPPEQIPPQTSTLPAPDSAPVPVGPTAQGALR